MELLPIHEFDETDCVFINPVNGERNRNFWGYNSIAFAAPKASYASTGVDHGQVGEFREMVRAFHAAGIEVYLDVVFNHTGEGDHRGRTYSFRGLDNLLYYMVGPDGGYLNFSGCGNTVNCNHPVVRQLLMNCLRFWVADMHVDGLRFDLASVMGRDYTGKVLVDPPVVEMIAEEGVLSDTKLIAEPWDAGGLYQVGQFPFGRRWSEWNGHYRDDVRRFWRGDPGMAGLLATRLCGSPDLYGSSGRSPQHSLNFITCHDGFTLWDLVSYNQKHNDANGENNRDGSDANWSWNCGVEGDTTNPAILGLRRRQARNLLATLFLSQGVPMLLAGDEFLRTQQGNNNAWCQDNEVSWLDWSLAVKNSRFPALCARADRPAATAPGPAPPRLLRRAGGGVARRPAAPARLLAGQPQPGADAGRPQDRPRAGSRFLHGVQRLEGAVAVRRAAGAAGQALAARARHGAGAASGHRGAGRGTGGAHQRGVRGGAAFGGGADFGGVKGLRTIRGLRVRGPGTPPDTNSEILLAFVRRAR